MKLTTHRKTIISVLRKNKNPMSAENIMNELPSNTMNLSTIYRSLEKLYSMGMISKSLINHSSYFHVNDHDHHHYMICLNCKKMFELDCHIHDMINDIEKNNHYKIIQHDLTFYGYCNKCQKDTLGSVI